MKKAFKAAFPLTIPVMAGYICLGIPFGLLMRTTGYPVWYAVAMSIIIYSGALQYVAVPLLAQTFNPVSAFFLGLMISARHLFYGIPVFKKYREAGNVRPYLIFGLTDETFSIASTMEPPEGVSYKWFYLLITLFDHIYWCTGTLIGALFGDLLKFDVTGLDFVLTALFIVLFIEQLKDKKGAISGIVGLAATAAVLALYGSGRYFVILAMLVILSVLLAGRKVIEK